MNRIDRSGLFRTGLVVCLLSLTAVACAPSNEPVVIEGDDIESVGDYVRIATNWKVKPGDDDAWRKPEIDDSGWTEVSSTRSAGQMPEDWDGFGWFRKKFSVSPDLRNRTVMVYLYQSGASEYFLNGDYIGGCGVVGDSPEAETRVFAGAIRPIAVTLGGDAEQTVAIRFSNHGGAEFSRYGGHYGPQLMVAGYHKDADGGLHRVRYVELRKGVFAALPAMIALVHLLLFAFYPAARQNFYYALLCASFAWLNFVVWDIQFQSAYRDLWATALTVKLLTVVCSLASLRFIYSIFYEKVPRQFWFFIVAGVALMVTSTVNPIAWVNGFTLVALAEMLRAVVVAVASKKRGAWIVGIGGCVFVVCIALQMLEGIGVIRHHFEAVYTYGLLALLLSMSIYLAREFASASTRLQKRLAQVRALTEELKSANLKLTDYSRTLEEKVERRTREVSSKNAELEELLRELRDTQEQLIMQEKMASLGNLVAGVAHEINNPIGAVHAVADVNARCLDRIERVAKDYREDFGETVDLLRENNRITKEASGRIANIVKSLKSFARLDESSFQLADVDELLDTTLTLLRHQLGTRILVDRVYGEIPRLGCYPNELNQAFMNILSNAIQAIEGEGTIQVATMQEDGKVLIRVSDTGAGMTDSARRQVFDPGFTTRGAGVGTGLGMSITYRIIKKHLGEIDVESAVGEGCVVNVYLPTDLAGRV